MRPIIVSIFAMGVIYGFTACQKKSAGPPEEPILSGVKQEEKKARLEVPTRPPRAPEQPDAMPKVSLPPPD